MAVNLEPVKELKSVNSAPDEAAKFAELFQGFSKLNRDERLARLQEMGALNGEDLRYLRAGAPLGLDLAEKFIENVLGYFQMPLGVATNFEIDGRPYVIPMAVEETSIIAAASKTAKWVRECGSITTEMLGNEIIGQIQIAKVNNFERLVQLVREHETEWVAASNRDVASGMVRRGGGVKRLEVRRIARGDGRDMAVLHVFADPCDAMGANVINQVCEYLKAPVEMVTGEKVTMCILSNLVDSRLTRARVEMVGLEEDLMERIEEASLFAQQDPYRAATNNKGVLNGIDPILIATGNDWRAVEAGVHAFAAHHAEHDRGFKNSDEAILFAPPARDRAILPGLSGKRMDTGNDWRAVEAGVHAFATQTGQYRSITRWRREKNRLVGVFEAPVVLGVVGGVTTLHPTAKICLKMLKVQSAEELSRVCAAVGLVQNLGALRALTTVGIIEGHMKLHIKNLTLGAGADEREVPYVVKRLEEILSLHKRISLSNAIEVLKEVRAQRAGERT